MADDKIINLPRRPKPASDSTLTVVYSGKCQHLHIEVDEKLEKVKCADCKEWLNPIWVLTMLSREDSRLRDRWAGMRAEIRSLGDRRRFKCRNCGEMNALTCRVNAEDLRQEVERIKRDESL